MAKLLHKVAVRAGVYDGFIGNRILAHYREAADHMVLGGAAPFQINAAIKAFGFAWGRLRWPIWQGWISAGPRAIAKPATAIGKILKVELDDWLRNKGTNI